MRNKTKHKILLFFLVLTLSIPSVSAFITVKENVILRTRDNNARFTIGDDLTLYQIELNTSHVGIHQNYPGDVFTRYYLYVISPNDVQLTIDRWFPTSNSSAKLTITSPLATNITLRLYSPELLEAYAVNAYSYSWDSETHILSMVVNSVISEEFLIYTSMSAGIPPENVEVTISNMEGCGNWVFAEEKYYIFHAVYSHESGTDVIGTMKVAFTDEEHWINASYNQQVDTWSLDSGSDYVILKDGETSVNGDQLTVTFPIYFKSKIMDCLNVSIYMWSSNVEGATNGWELKAADYFHIYNLGGFSLTFDTEGDAGRITGGDVFDFYATNGSSVEADLIFRNLQHIKIAPSIYWYPFEEVFPGFVLEYRFDYCTADDDEWITGFGIKIFPTFTTVGATNRYTTWNVTLYHRGDPVESDIIYSYTRYNQSDYGGKAEAQFIIDEWFNKVNASSTCGARFNAYEYAMTDRASPWISWLTGSEWVPYEGVRKDLMLFAPLLDDNNETLYVPEIKLVRIYFKLEVFDCEQEYVLTVESRDYRIWDLTIDKVAPFNGVQTPQIDDTKVPFVYGGGLLGSLWSSLQGLWANIFSPSLLVFWDVLVSFLDTIAGTVGAPNFFSNLFSWIGESIGYLSTSMEYVLSIVGSIFTLFTSLLTAFLSTVTDLINSFVTTITMFTDMMEGGWGVGVNLWETFNIAQWLQLAMIFYPIYLVILWDTKGLDAVIQQLTWIFGLLSWLFSFFVTIIQFVIGLITSVVEAIPIAE